MKPRVAFFDFACCEGCQLQVINLEESIVDLIEIVEVVTFREAMNNRIKQDSTGLNPLNPLNPVVKLYDIAIIEGSIVRPMDEERLLQIRQHAKIIVALGACACIAGVNALRNKIPVAEVKKMVYEDANLNGNPYFDVSSAKAVDEVVKVDYYIPGCPITREEFARVISALVLGKKPDIPNYPVCVECKKRENICVFEKGDFCLGPISRAGCNAPCPTANSGCEGCRGLLDNPNIDSELQVLQKYGLTLADALSRFTMFWNNRA